jgi:predicted lipoprotein with Yx(FWY)xxD motif
MRYVASVAAVAAATLSMTLIVMAQSNPAPKLTVQQSKEYGSYVADADGRALYMYTKDKQATGGQPAESNCGRFCSRAWPPYTAERKPELGAGLDASLLGVVAGRGGKMQVTYGGWPLYYYAKDKSAGSVSGQGDDGVWYLVSPDGKVNRTGAKESE